MYLGVPIYSGNKKTSHFQPLIEKVRKKLLGGNISRLSHGGRLLLIQSILCSLPAYLLQVLLPPLSVLHQLEMIFANFFWGSSGSKGKTHWVSWFGICKPKMEGGLGVRRLYDVAMTLSMILWFRLREQETSWAKFLSRMYCGVLSPVVVPLKGIASPSWRRMIKI